MIKSSKIIAILYRLSNERCFLKQPQMDVDEGIGGEGEWGWGVVVDKIMISNQNG